LFKDYKAIFKNLRAMQDQLWKDSMASFPGSAFPAGLDDWQQQTLANVNDFVGQAVRQSLELQREWLDQWSDRAGDKKLKPKVFAELSAEARNSTERWLDNQNQLWSQWLRVLGGSGGAGTAPDFEVWEQAVQESIRRQMSLLRDWSEMADVEKLSGNEAAKLFNQITKAMEKSIETQQRLWSHWFDELGMPGEAGKVEKEAAESKPKKKQKKSAAAARKTAEKSPAPNDDLKQISGIGPGLEKKLKDGGISSLRQIAELTEEDIARLEEQVIRFSGRIKREQWVEQARKLVS
jgi:predicted flap endonuclease-1-like 5' DNA nuclease